jgi:hypothetical protein
MVAEERARMGGILKRPFYNLDSVTMHARSCHRGLRRPPKHDGGAKLPFRF